MGAPRLRVAVIGHEDFGLAAALSSVGHHVSRSVAWDQVSDFECVVLALSEPDLVDSIPRLVPYSAPRQIFIHTCLAAGVDVLSELQAVGVAMHPVGELCAVGAEDELSETIANMLSLELGLRPVVVQETERADLVAALAEVEAARQTQQKALARMRSDATAALVEAAIGRG